MPKIISSYELLIESDTVKLISTKIETDGVLDLGIETLKVLSPNQKFVYFYEVSKYTDT